MPAESKIRYMPAQGFGIYIDLDNPQAQAVVTTRQGWRGSYIYLPLTDIAPCADLNPDELDHFLDWHVGGQLIAQVVAAWDAAAGHDHSTGNNPETLAAYRRAARLEHELVERIKAEVTTLPEPAGHWFAWDWLDAGHVIDTYGLSASTSADELWAIATRICDDAEQEYVSLARHQVHSYLCDLADRLAAEDAEAVEMIEGDQP